MPQLVVRSLFVCPPGLPLSTALPLDVCLCCVRQPIIHDLSIHSFNRLWVSRCEQARRRGHCRSFRHLSDTINGEDIRDEDVRQAIVKVGHMLQQTEHRSREQGSEQAA